MASKQGVISNFIWRFAERCGAQIVQFIVSIVLARILLPETFGTVALVIVIAQIFQVFVDSGLGNALIQKKDADDLDFSSVFWFNVVWCLFLYGVIYFTAPAISIFYKDVTLVPVIRVAQHMALRVLTLADDVYDPLMELNQRMELRRGNQQLKPLQFPAYKQCRVL